MSQSRLVIVLALVTALSVGAAGAQLLVPPVQAQTAPAAAIGRWEYHCAPVFKDGLRVAGERGWEMVGVYAVAASSTTEGTQSDFAFRSSSRHTASIIYCFKRPLP
jgi:hypothetical protein